MATFQYSDISSALPKEVQDEVRDQTNKTCVLLPKLQIVMIDGQPLVNFQARFSGSSAAYYTEGATFGTPNSDAFQLASLGFGLVAKDYAVTGFARDVVGAGGGVKDIEWDRFIEANVATMKFIEKEIITGAVVASNKIQGLPLAIAASGTYAGLSRSSFTEWQSHVESGADGYLEAHLMNCETATNIKFPGMRPDLILMSPATQQKYRHLFSSALRINDHNTRLTGSDVPNPSKDVFFQDIPVRRSVDVADDTVLVLNTKAMWLAALKRKDGLMGRGSIYSINPGQFMNDGNGMSSIGIPMYNVRAGASGHFDQYNMSANVQLIVDTPGACALINNVA